MFPQRFSARVAQRMAVWGAMLGFLVLLLLATDVIQSWQAGEIAHDRQQATAAAMAVAAGETASPAAAGKAAAPASAKEAMTALEAIDERAAGLADSQRQNKMLLVLLTLFVVGEILVLERHWLIGPILRISQVLQDGARSTGDLQPYASRRDEIGTFAQALSGHFALVGEQQEAARLEQERLSERLRRQEEFRCASFAFQQRIGEIIQRLHEHSTRMSAASQALAATSADAQTRAGASVAATARVSSHVDLVASSIQEIATTLTSVAEDAERTSGVTVTARSLVEAAKSDAQALSDSARTIEQVVALIEDVARQTNLLALNATIEASRAGEMGRGFAVVAQEVKQLATRTAQATEDVRFRLQGITAASSRIDERVAMLVESIEQVAGVVSAIAASMRAQDVSSQAITSNTSRTAADVRDVADVVKGVAAIIGDANEAADLVTKISTDLGGQADELRSAVERFVETSERIAA